MRYDPEKHHRRSIRLQGYDDRQPGAYFVTICTQGRACLFGDVIGGRMQVNDAGHMVQTVWEEIPIHYPGVLVDAFVVMPNHIHGIVILAGAGPRACPDTAQPRATGQPRGVAPPGLSLPDVVHRFKTLTAKRYADGVKSRGWTPFHGRLWQRNYYEHLIRTEHALDRIRRYIALNPLHWQLDRENPDRAAFDDEFPS